MTTGRGQVVGQNRPWASGQNRAATRRLTVVQLLTVVNGYFCQQRRTAPDPIRPFVHLCSQRLVAD